MNNLTIFNVIVVMIVTDIILGILVGYTTKTLNSEFGLIGVIKHSVVIILIIMFKCLTVVFNLTDLMFLIYIFYIIQYFLSIVENAYILGIPIPKFVMDKLLIYIESEELEKWEK